MLDIEGRQLTPADRALLVEPAVGGVILFSRNYASPAQLRELVASIRELRRPPLLIATDHEGGRVQRFREGFTAIPPMRRIGRQYDSDERSGLSLARTAGWLIAAELLAMRIDLCFAPCVDLDWGISEIIGNRAFHRSPDAVAELAGAFCNGLREAGMAAVAKHFPGHGAVVADSHEQLPVDRRDYGDVLDDMRPYERLIANRQLAGVMIAHIVYPEMDSLPASFSPYWMRDELRARLGFDGAILCDDLSMRATASLGTMPERARLALAAGCDMVIVCNDRPAASATVAALRDYSNPPSLVRLARPHGAAQPSRDALEASETWRKAAARLAAWEARPNLELDG